MATAVTPVTTVIHVNQANMDNPPYAMAPPMAPPMAAPPPEKRDELTMLKERVAALELQIDPPSSMRQSLIDLVDPKLVKYDRPLLLALIVGFISVFVTVMIFVGFHSSKKDMSSVNCIASVTYPQYVGNMWEQGDMIDKQKSMVGQLVQKIGGKDCYEVNNPNTSFYGLLSPEAATKDIKCDDPDKQDGEYEDGQLWYTGHLNFCISKEVVIAQAAAGRSVAANGWQYSPPHMPNTGGGMNIVIQQENCYPPDSVWTKIQLCPGLEQTYNVYSVAQGAGVHSVAAIKASSDYSKLTCPSQFVDTARIPWRMDYMLDYKICTHRSWAEKHTLSESIGLTLAYAVYADMAVTVLVITVLTGSGIVRKHIVHAHQEK